MLPNFLVEPVFIPIAIFLFFYWRKEGKLPFPIGVFGQPFGMFLGIEQQQPPPTPPTPTPPVCPTCPTCPDKKAIVNKIASVPVQVTEQGQFSKVGYRVPFTETQTTTIGGLVHGAEKAITGLQKFDENYGVQLKWKDGIDKVSVHFTQ